MSSGIRGTIPCMSKSQEPSTDLSTRSAVTLIAALLGLFIPVAWIPFTVMNVAVLREQLWWAFPDAK